MYAHLDQLFSPADDLADALFDAVPCAFWLYDGETLALLRGNPAAAAHCPPTRRELEQSLQAWCSSSGTNAEVSHDSAALVNTPGRKLRARPVFSSGRRAWLVLADELIDRREAAQAVAAAEARYQSIFHNAVEGIFQSTPDGRYLDANPALARIYGYTCPRELMASVTDISRQLYVHPGRRETFVQRMRDQGVVEGFESEIVRKDGSIVWISECVRLVRDGRGEPLYYEGTVVDITQRKVAEERLRHDAWHDRLTGLPNRAFFMNRAVEALEQSARGHACALLYVDLDRFKLINDSLGHMAGDQLLILVAQRLVEVVRPGDIVARLGGDEFGLLLPGIRSTASGQRTAERVQQAMLDPFEIGGRQLSVSASVGLAFGNHTYSRGEDLLRDADVAMYSAKKLGRGRRELFDTRMREQALEQLQLETDLHTAVQGEQFVLHYQPVVDLLSEQPVAFEALIRWNHPTRGLIPPGSFIPLAEDTGAILNIGSWVVESACRQARTWEAETGCDLPINVNISSRQFLQPDFAAWVGQTLDATGLPGSRLRIEITETVLMEDSENVARMLDSLRARGVGICLDDFGTGFSSLSYMQRFPIDQLKIDREFVARMNAADRTQAILETILNLARSLGLRAVAEGVETAEQAEELRRLGCPFAQGYYYSHPVPASDAIRLLRNMAPA